VTRAPGSLALPAPEAARWIVATLEKRGFETWAVGGAVRDALLGVPSEDWDFATLARPGDVQATFRRTVPVGIDHGTVGVLDRHGHLHEVTTFRQDVKALGRRAVVRFSDTLAEDLARRDFTINAIAWHPGTQQLFDPFHGRQDLRLGVLRTVGVPAERFREDYLRILRGLRFAGRLRLDIEADTWGAMVAAAPHLDLLSVERLREELMKVLGAESGSVEGLQLYASSGALAAVFRELDALREPGTEHHSPWTRALRTVAALPPSAPLLRFAALGQEVVRTSGLESLVALMLRLKFSRADCERVVSWTEPPFDMLDIAADGAGRRRWLARVQGGARGRMRLMLAAARTGASRSAGVEPTLGAVRALRREVASAPPLSVQDLQINGRDLMRLGLVPGPRVGEVLRALLAEVLDDPACNLADVLSARALELIHEETPP